MEQQIVDPIRIAVFTPTVDPHGSEIATTFVRHPGARVTKVPNRSFVVDGVTVVSNVVAGLVRCGDIGQTNAPAARVVVTRYETIDDFIANGDVGLVCEQAHIGIEGLRRLRDHFRDRLVIAHPPTTMSVRTMAQNALDGLTFQVVDFARRNQRVVSVPKQDLFCSPVLVEYRRATGKIKSRSDRSVVSLRKSSEPVCDDLGRWYPDTPYRDDVPSFVRDVALQTA